MSRGENKGGISNTAPGTAKFMQQSKSGKGDYSKERHKILRGLTVDDILEEIKRKRAKR